MKKSRFGVSILKQPESKIPISEICRKHSISSATFYNWRSKYGDIVYLTTNNANDWLLV